MNWYKVLTVMVTLKSLILVTIAISAFLSLVGCAGIVRERALPMVEAYCGKTPQERFAFRASINAAIYPNEVELHCLSEEESA